MQEFTILVFRENQTFTAMVPALPSCTREEKSRDEAFDKAAQAIRSHVHSLLASAKPIPSDVLVLKVAV